MSVRLYVYITQAQMKEVDAIVAGVGPDAFGARSAVLRKMIFYGIEAYKRHKEETGRYPGMTMERVLATMRDFDKETADDSGEVQTPFGESVAEAPASAD